MSVLLLKSLRHVAAAAHPAVRKSAFARRGLTRVVVTRAIAASATPSAVLIPWSCEAFMAATLGVAMLKHLPYAVFNFASPLIVIALACSGIRMMRRDA